MSSTPDKKIVTRTLRNLDVSEYEDAVGFGKDLWAQQCHAVSIALVKSGLVHDLLGFHPRVARGAARGVAGQHSWVTLGDDCYDERIPVLDLTLWSYDPSAPVVCVELPEKHRHRPHGLGSIFTWGQPTRGPGPAIELTPVRPLSSNALMFLDMLGPLDLQGWATLASAPVQGWPAGEIVEAMLDTDGLGPFVPIDRVGMLTYRNPSGLYLHPSQTKET